MNLENNFDIIHSHSPLVPVIRTKLTTVLTEHGTVKGGLDNSQLIDIHSIITKLFSREFISWDLKTLNNSNHITVVSQSCKEELINRYGIKKEIIVVNNGVDTAYFSPREIKDIIEPYILYTGRLDSRKGLVDFVESAKFISQEYPNMKFILTGSGPLKKYLEQKIETLGLKRNFYFAGFVDRQKLLEYYQNATIYILPSYYECLPTTLLEAMSCGIPSIATNVDGSSEVIVNYENGILVTPKNPKELAKSVLTLLNNKSLRQELGINARNYVIETYDWNNIVNKFEDIYYSIRS